MSHRSTVSLRHATPTKHIGSILRWGIDPKRAKGKLPVVWLHSASRSKWAVEHVAERHSVEEEAVTLFTIHIPREWLVRRKGGIWTTTHLITKSMIQSVNPRKWVA